jgi:crossover junction endodeoxyribonuclease RusA
MKQLWAWVLKFLFAALSSTAADLRRKALLMPFEFVIPRRPVSLQTRRRERLQQWKEYVRAQAATVWLGHAPFQQEDLSLTLVYLFDDAPVDTDNIIKPIQDALVGLVFEDDILVTDVRSHRRIRTGIFDFARLPAHLIHALDLGEECVYVRVSNAPALEDIL